MYTFRTIGNQHEINKLFQKQQALKKSIEEMARSSCLNLDVFWTIDIGDGQIIRMQTSSNNITPMPMTPSAPPPSSSGPLSFLSGVFSSSSTPPFPFSLNSDTDIKKK